MREHLTRRRGSDEGMTLTELLVAMMVFAIASVLVFNAVILIMRTMNEVQESSEAVSEARLALMTIDRQVRSGNVLFSPADEPTNFADGGCVANGTLKSGTCMRIFTQANGAEKCVQWQLLPEADDPTSYQLRMRSWGSGYPTSGTVSGWSVAARDLVLDQETDGSPIYPFRLRGAESEYDERLLQVELDIRDARTGKLIELNSSLAGRNTSYGFDAGQCLPVPPA